MKKAVLLLMVSGAVFLSCKKGGNALKAASLNGGAGRVINIAHTAGYVPYDFIDNEGNSNGFEVAVLKAANELLPQYTFRFHGVSDDELLIGVESGKYQAGVKGVWMTEERKKKYTFPSEPIAVSVIGITYRATDKDVIHDMDSFAKYSGKLVPIGPQNAQYNVVVMYNKEHPDCPIKLIPSDSFEAADAYTWVLEGRYDAYLNIKLSHQNNVEAENGAYHQLASRLAYAPYKGIPTWPLFNRKEQELANDYDNAIKT